MTTHHFPRAGRWALLMMIVLSAAAAAAQVAAGGLCPMHIYIGRANDLHENRFQAGYRVSWKTLASDLQNGCKQSAVTSVVVDADPHARFGTVQRVLELVRAKAPAGTPVSVLKP